MRSLKGSCHCGAIYFTVSLPDIYYDDDKSELEVFRCNCSICTKSGYLHLHVELRDVKFLGDSRPFEDISSMCKKMCEKYTMYAFGTGTARHTFCRVCGVKAFYVPRSNPRGLSVNLNCIDDREKLPRVKITEFGGDEWEKNRHKLGDGGK